MLIFLYICVSYCWLLIILKLIIQETFSEVWSALPKQKSCDCWMVAQETEVPERDFRPEDRSRPFPIYSLLRHLLFIPLFLHSLCLRLFPLSVWEVVHSWAFAVCWRAVRRSRRRWKWPARATPPTWTNWWKISTEATMSALAYRAPLWHPGERDEGFITWGSATLPQVFSARILWMSNVPLMKRLWIAAF